MNNNLEALSIPFLHNIIIIVHYIGAKVLALCYNMQLEPIISEDHYRGFKIMCTYHRKDTGELLFWIFPTIAMICFSILVHLATVSVVRTQVQGPPAVPLHTSTATLMLSVHATDKVFRLNHFCNWHPIMFMLQESSVENVEMEKVSASCLVIVCLVLMLKVY